LTAIPLLLWFSFDRSIWL